MLNTELNSYSLTHCQKRIWFFQLLNPDSFLRNSYAHFPFEKPVDKEILIKSIQLLINENDAFRLSITQHNGELRQFFQPKIDNINVKEYDFSDDQKGFEDFIDSKVKEPFSGNKLYHFSIIKYPDKKEGVFFGVNHVIGDASTIILIVEKITKYYDGLISGDNAYTPKEESFQYVIEEEKEYLASESFQQDRKYWLEKFKDIPESSLSIQEPGSIAAKEQVFWIDEPLEQDIKSFCEKNSLRFYHVLMASFCLFLGRMKDTTDITIGTLSHGRYDDLMKKMIGMFVNTLTLRLSIDFESMNFHDWIDLFKREMSDVISHQRYPYDTLMGELKSENKGLKDLFNIIINYQRVKYAAPCERIFNGSDEYELAFNVYVFGEEKRFQIKIQYQTELYSENNIRDFFESYCALLKDCIELANQPLFTYSLVSNLQKKRLLETMNQTRVEIDFSKCLHQHFEEQARVNPEKTALVFNDKTYSYRELNNQSNKLANYLLDQFEIQPDDRIGLLMQRSDLMIVAMIAILKSGGAYVPVDPEYPVERINFIAADSDFKFLLSEEELIKNLKDQLQGIVLLDAKTGLERGGLYFKSQYFSKTKPSGLYHLYFRKYRETKGGNDRAQKCG